MKHIRKPYRNAVKYTNNDIYQPPTDEIRSVLAINGGSATQYFAGAPVFVEKAISIDVYPNEGIGGQWTVETNAGEYLYILELT